MRRAVVFAAGLVGLSLSLSVFLGSGGGYSRKIISGISLWLEVWQFCRLMRSVAVRL